MTHTVRPGDSLSRIAQAHGISLELLLTANPRFRQNPSLIHIGDVISIPVRTAAPAPPPPKPAAAPGLGKLSERYEVGTRGPGTVSTGIGDPGGVSYGSYQMTSKPAGGTVARFIASPGFPFQRAFAGLVPGTPAFSALWRNIASADPGVWHWLQHAFIRQTHYDPLVAKVRRETGLDIDHRTLALQDVAWSTAVQHGPATDVLTKAIREVGRITSGADYDRRLIEAVYAERGRRRADGKLARFPSSSAGVQRSVAERFERERRDALAMLEKEVGRR